MEQEIGIDLNEFSDLCKIIDFIPDIFILVNENGLIVHANNVLESILGWKPDEVIGSKMEILLPPELRSRHIEFRNQFLISPKNRDMNELANLSALHKKGHLVPIDIKLSFMELNGKRYSTAMVRDATVQRNLQSSLEEKNKVLKQVSVEKYKLLGIASHDMRNPIGMIRNFAQILLNNSIGPLNDEQNEFVSRIYQSSLFMMGLLEDLLDFSTIESDAMTLVKEEFSFSDLLDEVLCICRIQASEKQIGLSLDVDSITDVKICADKRKLHQVINNLVDNAIKYSHQQSAVSICAKQVGAELVFRVKDHGVGIPEDDQDKLFQPFFRARNKPTNGEKSTGLGLFITKRIVDAHNGKLSLVSKDSQGCEFTVRLPL